MFSNPFGNLFLKTEKPCYFAGETVSGIVYLQANQILQTNQIFIKIKGREHTRFTVTRTEYNQRTNKHDHITDTHVGQNLFYQHKFPLYNWGGSTVMPGQYQFPFSFILDSHLPGSFSYSEGQTLGVIRYKIKVELPSSVPIIFKPMKFTQNLVVREPMKGGATNLSGENRATINNCCMSQGDCFLKTSFEKDHYLPGETARLCYEVDNSKCKADIKNIVATFNMNLSFLDGRGKEQTKHIVVTSRTLPGVNAGESITGESRKYVELPLIQSGGLPIFPSTNGRLVKCKYTLSVTASPKGCNCCATDPTVSCGVVVFCAPPAVYDTLHVPAGWSAQVMPVFTMVLNDATKYASNNTSNQSNSGYAPPSGGMGPGPQQGGFGGGMGGGMGPGHVQSPQSGGMGPGPQQGGFGGGMGPGPQQGGFGGGMGGGMGPGMAQPGGMMSPGGGMGPGHAQ